MESVKAGYGQVRGGHLVLPPSPSLDPEGLASRIGSILHDICDDAIPRIRMDVSHLSVLMEPRN